MKRLLSMAMILLLIVAMAGCTQENNDQQLNDQFKDLANRIYKESTSGQKNIKEAIQLEEKQEITEIKASNRIIFAKNITNEIEQEMMNTYTTKENDKFYQELLDAVRMRKEAILYLLSYYDEAKKNPENKEKGIKLLDQSYNDIKHIVNKINEK